MKSPLALIQAALEDIVRLEPCVKGTDRDYLTICRRVEDEGLGFLTKTLPSFCDAFDEGLATGQFTCPIGFKRHKRGVIPRFLSGITCEIFDSSTGLIRPNPNLSLIKFVRQFCRLYKKMHYDEKDQENLDRLAKRKFFEVEENIGGIDLSPDELFTLRSVSRYTLPNLEGFDEREMECRHGPGAVSEGVSTNRKWNVLMRNIEKLEEAGHDIVAWSFQPSSQFPETVTSGDSAKLVTVPKDSRSRRTITIEPCWRQYLQQGLNATLRSHIEKCGILRNSLALTDQTQNQKLALVGSQTDEWATIDLSSASDLLSLNLVGEIFRDKPRFLAWLLYSRSPKVDDKSDLRKYAGMGNATTFPVQSVVFATLAIAAIVHGQKYPWYGTVKRVSSMVRVYGDDIIVPTEHAYKVVRWLEHVGLKVNVRKSFLSGKFKESCGVDAYAGVDVTPVYVRYHPSSIRKRDPSSLAHYVSLANMFYLQGHYSMSEICREWVEEVLGRLPLVHRSSGLLGLHTRVDASEFHSWDSNLHRPRLKAYRLLPKFKKDTITSYEALFKCLASPFQEDPKHLERSPVRFRNRLRHGWVAP